MVWKRISFLFWVFYQERRLTFGLWIDVFLVFLWYFNMITLDFLKPLLDILPGPSIVTNFSRPPGSGQYSMLEAPVEGKKVQHVLIEILISTHDPTRKVNGRTST
jgi:hypothetical protein